MDLTKKLDGENLDDKNLDDETLGEANLEDGSLEKILSDPSLPSIRGQASNQASRFFYKSAHSFYSLYWRYIFATLFPIFSLTVFAFGTHKGIRWFYIQLVMYLYYLFDIFPEGIVSLIPIFTLPLMMIQHTYTTCSLYFQYGFFVVNALFIAICIDYSGIHERITLWFMLKFGGTPRAVHAVLSTITLILSIRIANAYTVVMMTPLAKKILYELDTSLITRDVKMSTVNFKLAGKEDKPSNLCMAFFYGIINASTLGGFNFVSGTITNMIYRSVYQRRYPYCGIAQTPWYSYTMPITLVSFIISVVWIQFLYLGFCRKSRETIREHNLLTKIFREQKIIEKLYKSLGKMSQRQICVLVAFLIYLILWYIDEILYFIDEKEFFLVPFIADSTPYLIICFCLMILPMDLKVFHSFSSDPKKRPRTTSPSIIPYEILQSKLPWGRILVIGSCVAMANSAFQTGIVETQMSYFSFLKDLNYWVLLLIVTLFGTLMTETISNGIVCGAFSPYIIELAVLANIHPLYLSLPFCLCCNMAMCCPYSSLNVRNVNNAAKMPNFDLFVAGIVPKVVAWGLIFVTFDNYGKFIFHSKTIAPSNFSAKLTEHSCFCEPCAFNYTRLYDW